MKSSRRDTAVGDGRENLNGEVVAAVESFNQANPKEQEGNKNG